MDNTVFHLSVLWLMGLWNVYIKSSSIVEIILRPIPVRGDEGPLFWFGGCFSWMAGGVSRGMRRFLSGWQLSQDQDAEFEKVFSVTHGASDIPTLQS